MEAILALVLRTTPDVGTRVTHVRCGSSPAAARRDGERKNVNHKRKRPKHQRAGCLLCKAHKDERRRQRTRAPALQDALEAAERDDVSPHEVDDYYENHSET